MSGKMKSMTTSKDVMFKVADFLKVKGGMGAAIENHGPGVDNISRTGKHVYIYNKNECFFLYLFSINSKTTLTF